MRETHHDKKISEADEKITADDHHNPTLEFNLKLNQL